MWLMAANGPGPMFCRMSLISAIVTGGPQMISNSIYALQAVTFQQLEDNHNDLHRDRNNPTLVPYYPDACVCLATTLQAPVYRTLLYPHHISTTALPQSRPKHQRLKLAPESHDLHSLRYLSTLAGCSAGLGASPARPRKMLPRRRSSS